MKTIKQLQKIMADGYAARNEIDKRRDEKLNKANKRLVGTCQKFRNSYGGDNEKWWLYRMINSVDGAWCKSFRFQMPPGDGGRLEVELNAHGSLGDGWIPCTHVEFYEAYNTLLDRLPSTPQREPKP